MFEAYLVVLVILNRFAHAQQAAVDPKSDERRTPLVFAASHGAVDVVKLLMERGADVTIRDTELQSVLHAAVGHPRVMEILLQVRDPNEVRQSNLTEHYLNAKATVLTLSAFRTRAQPIIRSFL